MKHNRRGSGAKGVWRGKVSLLAEGDEGYEATFNVT